ncbi:hypothetical protein [Methanocaldococcus fervens]|uniref:VAR1 protein isolog n=1 Tax=Methanocaldococcus fervens (strain DSM 4213 / JCM 15782 / AG86) TaxID=573064 RepID=C7P5B8_METFA|nr:hypothetical protein [Methanocaldococcus fervens]ACV25296.1 hypothetical protein Mefer_1493 [Methanocaldococcus fervens AG86]
MRKTAVILFIIINILPLAILGIYLYENIGGAENVNEVVKNSPFKEFVYIDHKTLMILKDSGNIQNVPEILKESLIFINGIYIGDHGSVGIKMPLGFLVKYIPIENFEYYNGVLITNPSESDFGKAEINDLISTIPQDYKDVIIYKQDYAIGIYYDLKTNKTHVVYVFKKSDYSEINTEMLEDKLLQETNAVSCEVINMGDKVCVYLEFNGINLDLMNNGIS